MVNLYKVLFLSLLCFSLPLWAVYVKETDFQDKLKNSDFVFIGEVINFKKIIDNEYLLKYAKVKVKTVLHPKVENHPEYLFFLIKGPISENHPYCCKMKIDYLFFSKRLKPDYYESVNGPYGVYEITNGNDILEEQ
jgi:hypothetical protein